MRSDLNSKYADSYAGGMYAGGRAYDHWTESGLYAQGRTWHSGGDGVLPEQGAR
jgi:hypothetical protein